MAGNTLIMNCPKNCKHRDKVWKSCHLECVERKSKKEKSHAKGI